MSHTVSWSKLVRPVDGSIAISDRGREPDVNAFLGKAYEISHIQSSICVAELLNFLSVVDLNPTDARDVGKLTLLFTYVAAFTFFYKFPNPEMNTVVCTTCQHHLHTE